MSAPKPDPKLPYPIPKTDQDKRTTPTTDESNRNTL